MILLEETQIASEVFLQSSISFVYGCECFANPLLALLILAPPDMAFEHVPCKTLDN